MKTSIHVYKVPGKNFMLAFESETTTETIAGNNAIEELMKLMDLKPLHQIGTHLNGNNMPGFHAWEAWAEVDEGFMTDLVYHANKRASELMEIYGG